MFDPVALFKKRLSEHLKLLNRYLRYIFNGHFMIALIFLIITLAIYYQQWLEGLSDDFPAAIVIAIALGAVVSYNPIQSFLKEPDLVFLIAKEKAMYRYFWLALIYNFLIQLYLVVLVVAALSPLYIRFFPDNDLGMSLLILLVVLVTKARNLFSNWQMMQMQGKAIYVLDKLLRTFLSIVLIYTLFIDSIYFFIVGFIYVLTVVGNSFFFRRRSGLAWDALIVNDQQRLAVFYRFVSLFADVPHVTKQLRKRKLLSMWIQRWTSFKQDNTFNYLYRLTFIRSGDYLSLFVRLTVIGGVVVFFVPNIWLKVVLAVLFLYMTSFQLISLFFHHRLNIWLDLYPIGRETQQSAFLALTMKLTIVQTVLLASVFLLQGYVAGFFLAFAIGTLFNYGFHHLYVKKRLQTN